MGWPRVDDTRRPVLGIKPARHLHETLRYQIERGSLHPLNPWRTSLVDGAPLLPPPPLRQMSLPPPASGSDPPSSPAQATGPRVHRARSSLRTPAPAPAAGPPTRAAA